MKPRDVLANARALGRKMAPAAVGSSYERASVDALTHKFGSSGLGPLRVVGRAGDRGVDLVGKWKSIDFLVQCKASSSLIPGKLWRDLAGVHTQKISQAATPTLVALMSPLPMTQAGLTEFTSSSHPFMHCILPKNHRITAITLNAAARSLLKEKEISL